MKRLTVWLIKAYQATISRITPPSCRFVPTCSQYGIEAVNRFGVTKGGWLTAKRLARCNPVSPGGYDPVPLVPNHDGVRDSGTLTQNL